MPNAAQTDERLFETEVRRLAAQLFPRAATRGPVKLGGRERDGVYLDGDTIHVVEATVSQKKQKALDDLNKSAELVKLLRQAFPEQNFKIWFITRDDPTADQSAFIPSIRKKAKCPVELCSFRSFSAKLVDSARYLELRDNHPFGSIRRPEDDKDFRVPLDEYVHIDLLNPIDRTTLHPDNISALLASAPQTLLLIGDFGAGKSMTLRHVFYGMKRRHLTGETNKFPVYLNLREHFGQKSPSEALMRHGEEIGFPSPDQLVAAWKAGHCHVFLDGFDELSSTRLVRGIQGLKQARKEAMRLVYGFLHSQPKDTALFISGREHYFDSIDEMKTAFGLSSSFQYYTLNEFTQEQIVSYLSRKGFADSVPDWLPARPLLVGYLAIKGLLVGEGNSLSSLSREDGWNHLLDRICEREAHQIDPVSIDPHAVREFVERLATTCRKTSSGRGPVHLNDIRQTFEAVFSMPPDEKAETLIFRMPGFTVASGQEDAREFIDDDYVDVCRAGDVARYVTAPHDPRHENTLAASVEMGELGCAVCARLLHKTTAKQVSAALERAADRESPYVAFDVIRVLQNCNYDYVGHDAVVRDGLFYSFDLSSHPQLDGIVFEGCLIGTVEVGDVAATAPLFRDCQIDNVYGVVGSKDVPPALRGSASRIANFVDDFHTNADILDLPLPQSVKVLMTVLRKLFVQPGRGRKENAFYRGLDGRARSYVPEILSAVEQLDFAHPHGLGGQIVWFPNRSRNRQAQRILRSPQQSTDPLVVRIRGL